MGKRVAQLQFFLLQNPWFPATPAVPLRCGLLREHCSFAQVPKPLEQGSANFKKKCGTATGVASRSILDSLPKVNRSRGGGGLCALPRCSSLRWLEQIRDERAMLWEESCGCTLASGLLNVDVNMPRLCVFICSGSELWLLQAKWMAFCC